MRVRYQFSSRKTKNIANIRKQREKYPKLLLKVVDTTDIVLEILDARFFDEMRNPEIEKLILNKGKQILYVLNKADLVDKKKIPKEALELVKPYVLVSAKDRNGIKNLRDKIKMMAKKVRKKEDSYERTQIGVIGYPNTGKSTLINSLIGKSSAGVGAEAGYTRGLQKLRLSADLLLLDSPGVIPERDYSYTSQEKITKHTKVGGKSFSQVKYPDIIVMDLMQQYPGKIEAYYGLKDYANDLDGMFEEIGKQKNFLKKGGEIDDDKVARKIIKDFQEGKIKL